MSGFGVLGLALLLIVGSVAGLDDFWSNLRAEADVVEKINRFSFELASVAFADPHGVSADENAVIAPINVWMELIMLASGAGGNTKRELELALRWTNTNSERSGVHNLMTRFENLNKWELNMVHQIFYNKKYQIQARFNEKRSSHEPQLEGADFSLIEETRQKLNEIFLQKSHGRFVDFMPKAKFNASTSMFLATGSHFRATWADFYYRLPEKKSFRTFSGVSKEVNFVRSTGNFSMGYLYPSYKAHIIRLDYEKKSETEDSYYTYLVMPIEEGYQAFEELQRNLQFANVGDFQTPFNVKMNLYISTVDKLESTWCLERSLRKLNMNTMWNKNTADFSDITDDKEIYTNKFYHKTSIRFDDVKNVTENKGSHEADSLAPDFYLNRPFFVVTIMNQAVLFVTRIVDPTYV